MEIFRVDKEKPFKGPHQNQKTVFWGVEPDDAKFAMIMIHGRGASAESIIGLSNEFETKGKVAFLAPQASGFTWYPYSFLAPTEKNQPGLNSGLQAISDLVDQIEKKGIPKENIFLLGFSQGACLATEFVARHPGKYAGVIGLSGGLIGDKIVPSVYSGDLEGTPVFLGCSDIDPHIPKERVDETEAVFEKMGGNVAKKIYPRMGHLVNEDEILEIQRVLNSKL
ncbi:MAG: dienelactone hydrolase family protein [Balneola sp.]|jgi:phospholipase/carboxylesterase